METFVRKLFLPIKIILIIVLINRCEKITDPISKNKFQIYVDSLQVPETVNLTDTVYCKFYGFIGSNLCYQFSHFEVQNNSDQIDFKLWGYHTGGEICATAISKLRGKEFKFLPDNRGRIIINVFQPDNTILIDSVIVQ